MSDQESEQTTSELTPHDLEKREEEKLKAKFPAGVTAGRAISGHSAFLQKRLAKGQKFFDSGDYQMAKQKVGNVNKPALKVTTSGIPFPTGDAIPTPDTVPARKTSIIQQSKFSPNVS